MDSKLLPVWRAYVQSFDRNENPEDSFVSMYTGMIDNVCKKEQVNLDNYLAQLECLVRQEAKSNHCGWPRSEENAHGGKFYPTDEELLAAYMDSSLLDYI